MTVQLEWRAPRLGRRHALAPGHRRALCGRTSLKSGWLTVAESAQRDRCDDCLRIASWPEQELAGRIAGLPPVPEMGPRERYLRSRGLIP